MNILNLHGFGGSGNNNNFRTIEKLFPLANIVSETIDYTAVDPKDIITTYCESAFYAVAGNSFGGFFAYVIGAELGIKTILTNPCIPPADYIPKIAENYKYEKELRELWNLYEGRNKNCYVLLGLKDDVLDPQKTIRLLNGTADISFTPDCGHSLSGKDYDDWMKDVFDGISE